MNYILNTIIENLRNIPGWRTKRKIVVIESDDWGSIRTSSKENRDFLIKSGIDMNKCDFNDHDALESNSDMIGLFEVLTKYKDSTGRNPVFSPAVIVGNPVFEKIKENEFTRYYWEPFNETLKKYPEHDKVYSFYKYGIENRIFVPTLHGREHLNVQWWLKQLKLGNKSFLTAFQHGITGISSGLNGEKIIPVQAAFDIDSNEELPYMKTIIEESTREFEHLFGYKSLYFVPPNGPFNHTLDKDLEKSGIEFIHSPRIEREPLGNGKYKKNIHFLGQTNRTGLTYLSRNCFFEPTVKDSGLTHIHSVEKCLKQIETAFRWNKPSIIITHRLNYVGYIEEKNRELGLNAFDNLLKKIISNWPDVEFLTSVELGKLIQEN